MLKQPLRLALLAALLAGGCGSRVSETMGSRGFFLPDTVDVAQGKHVVLSAWPENVALEWTTRAGPGNGFLSENGNYYAPLSLSSERTFVAEATFAEQTTPVTLRLVPGPVERADCLAPGQPDYRDHPDAPIYVEVTPEPLVRVSPRYPDAAREAGVDGTVMVQAFVCACGEVSDVRVVNSIPLLDEAAMDAVRQWSFVPALTDGEPVAIWVGIPVKFSLH